MDHRVHAASKGLLIVARKTAKQALTWLLLLLLLFELQILQDGSRANNLGKALTALLSDKDTPVTVKYADYDWSLNSKM